MEAILLEANRPETDNTDSKAEPLTINYIQGIITVVTVLIKVMGLKVVNIWTIGRVWSELILLLFHLVN